MFCRTLKGGFNEEEQKYKCRAVSTDTAGNFILPENLSTSSGKISGIEFDPSGVL